MGMFEKIWIFFIAFLITYLFINGGVQKLEAKPISLPISVGKWTRQESSQPITADTIFNYMDGAGELYLGYRFNHLDVFEYVCEGSDNILVEVYDMETTDDAFGLLSLDWDGEMVSLKAAHPIVTEKSKMVSPVAIYGAGLLRIWSDNLYCRIMIYRETPEAKQAIIAIGKAIVNDQKPSIPPRLIRAIPENINHIWHLRSDHMSYFRSYMVLNSIYYISLENILNLDHSIDAVAAAYTYISNDQNRKTAQSIWIHYKTPEQAVKALKHFQEAYLSDHHPDLSRGKIHAEPVFFKLEEGWLAYRLVEESIAIVSGCPSKISADVMIGGITSNLK